MARPNRKTLLLVFIHGFKGGEDTFGPDYAFAHDLSNLLLDRYFIPFSVAAAAASTPDDFLPPSASSASSSSRDPRKRNDFLQPPPSPSFARPSSPEPSFTGPLIDVQTAVYPRYETRGDLAECVAHFRDWLLNRVIDIEVSNHTPSPTVEPSVRVILCGHSMGGIVAAETVIALTSDQPVPFAAGSAEDAEKNGGKSTTAAPEKPGLNSMMFPYVQGVLAFDTPYLGISPGVVAHGAEGHYNTVSQAATQLSGLSAAVSGLWGGSQQDDKNRSSGGGKRPMAALPAPVTAPSGESAWGKWGRMAMYAGAASVAVGGAAAAYMKREQLTIGFTWVSSHLEFVGCLARGEELRRRVAYMALVQKKLGIGFGNVYTRLGKAAESKQVGNDDTTEQQQAVGGGASVVATVLGKDRTFCNLPTKQPGGEWVAAVNDKASDEVSAHMGMFEPKQNPGYQMLLNDAAKLIASWTEDWIKQKPIAQITST